MSEYYSNAKWSKIGHSYDRHCNGDDKQNKEFAESICEVLLERWGHNMSPCEVRGTCLKTWVSKDNFEVRNE